MGKGTHENTHELLALVTSGMSYLGRAIDLHGDAKNSEVRSGLFRGGAICTERTAVSYTYRLWHVRTCEMVPVCLSTAPINLGLTPIRPADGMLLPPPVCVGVEALACVRV